MNMKILAVETSCDETAVAIIEAEGDINSPSFNLLSTNLFSQIEIHRDYGGVYPNLAKREHSKNLTPILKKTLDESGVAWNSNPQKIDKEEIKKILEREEGLFEDLDLFLKEKDGLKPDIDLIVVTKGPGLAPALWVGVSFAKALSKIFDIPVLGVNHMKGHIASVLRTTKEKELENKIVFPAISLLISGGHTEIVYMENWQNYKILGQTLDDAVGEAFDKVARMMDLKYPGGPEISKLAEEIRDSEVKHNLKFPRPMIHSNDLNFSFSGLKTAVLYTIQKLQNLTEEMKKEISLEFENAVTDVLISKTKKALIESSAKTLIIGGGVISNNFIRKSFENMIGTEFQEVSLKIADKKLATDNAVMIAMAGYIEYLTDENNTEKEIRADGNLKF